jgi:hypothetical protein
MKISFTILLLILCLSAPAFAGHTQSGGRWCECNYVQGVCPCCGLLGAARDHENESFDQNASGDARPTVDIGVIRLAFLMWLKVKA